MNPTTEIKPGEKARDLPRLPNDDAVSMTDQPISEISRAVYRAKLETAVSRPRHEDALLAEGYQETAETVAAMTVELGSASYRTLPSE